MSFIIRKANEQDTALIIDFIRQLAEYEKMSGDVIMTEKQFHHELFEERNAECLIGEEDGKPVGFALYFFNFSTFVGKKGLYIEDLFIKKEHRGKGYGKSFFKALAKAAEERNCGRMEWSCLNWNTPSIAFYQSLGAIGMDEWTVHRLNEEQILALAKQ